MVKRILVIDDDRLVLRTLEQLLKRAGFEISSAGNCSEALNLVKNNLFNLIISDIRMPEEDGISVIKKIKSFLREERKAEIPVIFITGYASEDTPIEAIKLGAKDYILKPFDLDELLKSVRQNTN